MKKSLQVYFLNDWKNARGDFDFPKTWSYNFSGLAATIFNLLCLCHLIHSARRFAFTAAQLSARVASYKFFGMLITERENKSTNRRKKIITQYIASVTIHLNKFG